MSEWTTYRNGGIEKASGDERAEEEKGDDGGEAEIIRKC